MPGVVARQMGTMDIYVQPSTVMIATELFLVQAALANQKTQRQTEAKAVTIVKPQAKGVVNTQ